MRGAVALGLVLYGCATTEQHSIEVYTSARRAEGCSPSDDANCCDALSRRMTEARARRDDRTADEEAEHLALSCPARSRAILEAKKNGALYRRNPGDKQSILVRVEYEPSLPPEDRIVWLATYIDEARLGVAASVGQHSIHVVAHIVSGSGVDAGKVFRLQRTAAVDLTGPDDFFPIRVALRRVEGRQPFALEAILPGSPEGGVEGGFDITPAVPPLRSASPPPFQPPVELQSAAAPALWLDVCTDGSGRVHALGLDDQQGAPHAHPRQLAAAVDWARRLEFEAPERPQSKTLFACAAFFMDLNRLQVPRAAKRPLRFHP